MNVTQNEQLTSQEPEDRSPTRSAARASDTRAKHASGKSPKRKFHRSRRVRENRAMALRKEARFMRVIYSIAAIATFTVLILIYLYSGQIAHAAGAVDETQAANLQAATGQANDALTKPVLGQFSIIDLGGILFVVVAGFAVYRRFNSKD